MSNFRNYPITKFSEDGKPLRYFTGKPCCNGHVAERLSSTGSCIECNKERTQRVVKERREARDPKTAKFVTRWNPDGSPLRYTFFKKCIRGHEERRYSDNVCIECEKIRVGKYNATEKGRECRVRARPAASRRNRKYLQTPKGKVYQRKQNQLENTKKAIRAWQQTEKGKMSARLQSHNRRMQKLSQGFVPFSTEDLADRFNLFDNRCVYCYSPDRITIDHFIPLKHGGSHRISNIVPSCHSCNVRKNAIMPYRWFKRQDFFNQKRWERILLNTELCDGVGYHGDFLGEFIDVNPDGWTPHSSLDTEGYEMYEYLQSLSDYEEYEEDEVIKETA